MVTYPIADVLTRIRNAQRAKHPSVRLTKSKVAKMLLDLLHSEGFISYVEEKSVGACGKKELKFGEYEVGLKYFSNGEPCITKATRMSKPGKRVYSGVEDIPLVKRGLGLCVVSTSQGIISDREARKRNIGGEVMAVIG
jgi:small subunit ribosomal protein S8